VKRCPDVGDRVDRFRHGGPDGDDDKGPVAVGADGVAQVGEVQFALSAGPDRNRR
jgi:hypothetical protein